LPHEISNHRWDDPRDLAVKEVDRLGSLEIMTNIFLSENYAPFQYGQYFHCFYDGFAIKGVDLNAYLKRAQQLKSRELFEYRKLMEVMQKEEAAIRLRGSYVDLDHTEYRQADPARPFRSRCK
jgi:hypothetical protein